MAAVACVAAADLQVHGHPGAPVDQVMAVRVVLRKRGELAGAQRLLARVGDQHQLALLHREVDAFRERSGIDAALEIRGDPESLTSAQRIAVYRAIQESLSNVREHSGATMVEIRLRMRRSSIEVRVVDDGQGFEVGRALARAAQRGRLGIVGIGERVRMLGGSFEIDSAPGGPTMLTFALPRIQPDR